MKEYYIHNARICFEDRIKFTGLWIKDGAIYSFGNDLNPPKEVIRIDAKESYLLPGFMDVHTHLDDTIGDYYLADTYESGSKNALQNGITSLYSFVTQSPNKLLTDCLSEAKEKAIDSSFTNVGWHLTPTDVDEKNIAELIELVKSGTRTIKLYSTYKEAGIYSHYDEIKKIAELLKDHDVTILVHCEDEEVLNSVNEAELKDNNAHAHAILRPVEAEIKAVEEIIKIAHETGVKFHIVHVSSYEALELVNEAQSEVKITCETCPQYLLLNEDYLKGEDGYQFLCSPPLRSEHTRLAMYESIINGKVDILATDHCVFTKSDKSKEKLFYQKVPKGLAGIGALVPIAYEVMKYKSEEAFQDLRKILSTNPAKLVGKYPKKGSIQIGSDADLVLMRDGNKRKIKASLSDSYDPYEGMETTLDIVHVFINGELVVSNNEIIDSEPKGKLL